MREYALKEIAEVIRGVTFSKAEGTTSPSDDRIPVIRAGSIQDLLLLDEGQIWVPAEKVKPHQAIRKNDIIMCTSSGSADLVGKCARSDRDWNGSFGAFCAGIRPDERKCDPSYLFHFLRSPIFRQWTKGSSGANIKNIRATELAAYKIPLPTLEEQRYIAGILDKADALRRKREKAINLNDELLRSVFLNMFGDPVSNPKGWDRKPLGECTFIDAPMVDPKQKEFQGMLHVGADKIKKNTGEILECLTAEEERLISNKFLFDENYILYTKIRPYLKKVALPKFKGLCSADVYPVRPDLKILTKEFLWYVLISDAFVSYTESLPSRANIPKINRKEFSAYEIIVPPLELQKQYSDLFLKISEQKEEKVKGLGFAKNLFSSLSQKAFNGELNSQKEAA